MSQSEANLPDGARILNVSRSTSGNVLLLLGEGEETKVLKLYRERRGRAKEILSGFSHRFFERKRGTRARARYATERLILGVWETHGFDVFRRLDLPLPERCDPPALWFEYYRGETLSRLLKHGSLSLEDRRALLRRLGGLLSRRHTLAVELAEPLLAHEHGTLNHIFICGERMITFDFEGGFLRGFSILEALAQEMAGYVRSLSRRAPDDFQDLLGALLEGYQRVDLLREIAQWGVHHQGHYRKIRRWYDQRQRQEDTKTDSLRLLLAALPAPGVTRSLG